MRHDLESHGAYRWIDVTEPSQAELQALAQELSLPETVVEDCLDPEHLPKHERIGGDATFLILRARDHAAPDDASTVQALTRKVAVFFREGLVLSVHRVDLGEIRALRDRVASAGEEGLRTQSGLVAALVTAALDSYEKPLERAEALLERFERGVFDDDVPAPSLREAHNLKRRVSLTRRILWQTNTTLQKLVPPGERAVPLYQDMRETGDAYLFWVERLLDEVNLLLQAHLAMSSNRTNEVMRVLTVFAAFFLPLTFIAGVYGMNFERMPELKSPIGYPATLAAMLVVAAAIFAWFRRRGWL